MKAAFLLGRVLFGGFFLYNGINHFAHCKPMAEHARSKHVPMPEAAVLTSGAQLALGGASVLLGVQPKLGAGLIAGFLIAVSPLMHDFWNVDDQQQRMNEMINFSKNVALLGAAAALAAHPEPWEASVQSLREQRRKPAARMYRMVRRKAA